MYNPADYFIEILATKSNNNENALRVQVRVDMKVLKYRY